MAEKIWLNIAGTGTFEARNTSGALFTPTTMSMWVKPPNRSEVAVTPTNTGTGTYSYSYTPTEPGAHTARMEGVTGGVVVCRGRGSFYVSPETF